MTKKERQEIRDKYTPLGGKLHDKPDPKKTWQDVKALLQHIEELERQAQLNEELVSNFDAAARKLERRLNLNKNALKIANENTVDYMRQLVEARRQVDINRGHVERIRGEQEIEREQAKADSERLDWLERLVQDHPPEDWMSVSVSHNAEHDNRFGLYEGTLIGEESDTLRQAIDTAREGNY